MDKQGVQIQIHKVLYPEYKSILLTNSVCPRRLVELSQYAIRMDKSYGTHSADLAYLNTHTDRIGICPLPVDARTFGGVSTL